MSASSWPARFQAQRSRRFAGSLIRTRSVTSWEAGNHSSSGNYPLVRPQSLRSHGLCDPARENRRHPELLSARRIQRDQARTRQAADRLAPVLARFLRLRLSEPVSPESSRDAQGEQGSEQQPDIDGAVASPDPRAGSAELLRLPHRDAHGPRIRVIRQWDAELTSARNAVE